MKQEKSNSSFYNLIKFCLSSAASVGAVFICKELFTNPHLLEKSWTKLKKYDNFANVASVLKDKSKYAKQTTEQVLEYLSPILKPFFSAASQALELIYSPINDFIAKVDWQEAEPQLTTASTVVLGNFFYEYVFW